MCIASPEFCVINLGSRLECASFVRYRAGAFILHDKCTATYACTCVFLYFALCPWVRAEQYVNARPWSAWGRNRPHGGEESLKMTFLNAILERTSPTLRTLQCPLPYSTPIAPLPTASLPPLLIHTQHHRFPHHTDYVTAIWHFHVTYFRLGPEDHVYAFNPPQDPAWLFSLLHLKWLVKGQLTWHNVVLSVDTLYSMYIHHSLYDHSKPMFSTGTNREAGIDNWNPFSKMLNNGIITSDINHSGRPSLPLRALLEPYVSTLFLS